MSKKPSPLKPRTAKSERGFALVLALSLMSLVFLLVVSLVSLVGTDLNLTELRKQKVLAQANAKMGMMIAIGEIQKHLGPDTRVSATADILDERVESSDVYLNQNYSSRVTPTDGIDLNEDNQFNKLPFGQRYWTGVWKHRAKSRGGDNPGALPFPENYETGGSIPTNTQPDSEYDPHPAIEAAWLVSGNEGYEQKLAVMEGSGTFAARSDYIEIPDGIPQDERVFTDNGMSYGQDENAWVDYQNVVQQTFTNQASDGFDPKYHHPLVELPDPENEQYPDETVWILKKPLLKDSYDPNNPQDWKNHLASEPVKVRKTRLMMSDNGSGINPGESAYAFWVGDEGVKTKTNLVNPNKGEEIWDDLAVATEPNLEAGYGISFASSIEEDRQNILALGMFAEIDDVTGDPTEKSDSMAAHYHGLTTDSFGVLSDVKTGGLKRDLSSAFSIPLSSQESWDDDFKGFLYQDRINRYFKTISLLPGAKENEWRDQGSGRMGASIDDKNFVLAGPRWDVLKDFHNKWKSLSSSNNLTDKEIVPDNFPRVTGDPHAIFPFLYPPQRPNKELKPRGLEDYINLFFEPTMRPEPTNHSLVPTLVEFKFSTLPNWTADNKLALAMYPSLAFWNPYNLPINLKDVYVEIPLNLWATAFNPKEWDLFLKWYEHNPTPQGTGLHSPYIPFNATTAQTTLPTQLVPPGFPRFLDLNGNGRRDPGEPSMHIPRIPKDAIRRPGGGGGGSPRPNRIDIFTRSNLFYHNFNMKNIVHPQTRNTFGNFRYGPGYEDYTGFPPDPPPWDTSGRLPRYSFFRSIDQKVHNDPTSQPAERVLLLKISDLQLDAGEKAHFVISSDITWPWEELGSTNSKKFITVNLNKGDEGFASALICKTEYTQTPTEPLTVVFDLDGYRGVNSASRENFNYRTGIRDGATLFLKPQGITMYGNDPRITSFVNLNILKKINKGFEDLQIRSHGGLDFSQADTLLNSIDSHPGDMLHGNGFRIRWKLPGSPDGITSVLFNQHNPRALVDSMQDGYGDNWKMEIFHGTNYGGKAGQHRTYCRTTGNRFHFYSKPTLFEDLDPDLHFTSTQMHGSGFETVLLDSPVVPKAGVKNSTGFFHDQTQLGSSMSNADTAVLFDLPRSPLLSIAQFKHANLNNFAHGPAYILGNSYASPQVGRHKMWTRFNSVKMEVDGSPNIQALVNEFNFSYQLPGGRYVPIRLFPWNENRWNTGNGAIRDENAANDHQNVTYDHSYYANYTLFDGYFLTGHEGDDYTTIPNNIEPGERFLPFRNPRLVPYIRKDWVENGKWKLTEYDQRQLVKVGLSKNEDLRYQSLAGDILLEGAFNVNSTSVNAWVAHLTALKGIKVPGSSMSPNETPFPRFFDEIDENSWNKICTLDDSEVRDLAKSLVKQIKLRGPFLSYADFVNRRILVESKPHPLNDHFTKWSKETRDSTLGLRGPIQAAIADSQINQGNFDFKLKSQPKGNPLIPEVPTSRFSSGSSRLAYPFHDTDFIQACNFQSAEFGLYAISKNPISLPSTQNPNNLGNYISWPQRWGTDPEKVSMSSGNFEHPKTGTMTQFKVDMISYDGSRLHGEAPDNLLAVENVATAANKPGWLMQADVLTPLAPVSSVRSDTFVIRVMGESPSIKDQPFSSQAWIELTVQRVPDYINSDIDAPHHRPHEPFEDANFDGVWNGDEHWLDLNKNSRDEEGNDVTNGVGAGPDLPGVGDTGADDMFADGLRSDLKLKEDKFEETLSNPDKDISYQGINQRFGRKFKIVKFRWLNENDV